ncbi:GIY-YIG catalytic domain-containing endonuclease [Paramecium bursaria Chlorella virus NE-JV-4]|nr:GIY-YIG catalytic domain-containing endonuclease [Paramecium bursaria Chlorella virus NE-JV-4]
MNSVRFYAQYSMSRLVNSVTTFKSSGESCKLHRIYKISFPSGQKYIGQTVKMPNERLKEHQRESSKCHRLKHALRTNPDFKLDTVAIVGPHQVHAVEKVAIALEDSTGPNGLNITIGGAGVKKPDEKYETYKMHVHDIYHRMKRGSFVSYDVLFMKNDTMLSEEEFQAIRRLL